MIDTMADAVSEKKQPPKIIRAFKALRDRKMAAMLLLSLAAGIPFGAVGGALIAWLESVDVEPSDVGVLSFITLAYSFKFIWAPGFQKPNFPVKWPFGARRSWLLTFQLIIAAFLALLALANPATSLGWVAFAALLIALASATHDIVLDAWRIEVAETEEDLDLMSALYQFGYRIAGLLTGALALVLAARIGWPATFGILTAIMAMSIIGTFVAPEPKLRPRAPFSEIAADSGIPRTTRNRSVLVVCIAWAVGLYFIGDFMYDVLTYQPLSDEQIAAGVEAPAKRNAAVFIRQLGPWIVLLTVVFPAIVAAFITSQKRPGQTGGEAASLPVSNALFASILLPLMDFTKRFGWSFILIFLLILMYRFADSVWGSYAYYFYLDDRFGALYRTNDEVALASKTFGVIMTVLGSALGASAILFLGRLPCLFLGALLAAVTNLLFADLAAGRFIIETATFVPTEGGDRVSAFLAFTQLDHLLELMPPLVGIENSQGLTNLMGAIAGENLAVGFASVASVAYLTSIVNPKYAAVQYAVLASLTMLIGTLGRAPLGEYIETDGYYNVFMLTFWIGLIPVVLAALEWLRQTLQGPASIDMEDETTEVEAAPA